MGKGSAIQGEHRKERWNSRSLGLKLNLRAPLPRSIDDCMVFILKLDADPQQPGQYNTSAHWQPCRLDRLVYFFPGPMFA